jgi:hypothetical protein
MGVGLGFLAVFAGLAEEALEEAHCFLRSSLVGSLDGRGGRRESGRNGTERGVNGGHDGEAVREWAYMNRKGNGAWLEMKSQPTRDATRAEGRFNKQKPRPARWGTYLMVFVDRCPHFSGPRCAIRIYIRQDLDSLVMSPHYLYSSSLDRDSVPSRDVSIHMLVSTIYN